MKPNLLLSAALAATLGCACTGLLDGEYGEPGVGGKADTPRPGSTLLQLEFDAYLVTGDVVIPESSIHNQLLYTIGQLNGDNAVGRLDAVDLSDVSTTALGGGRHQISYHALLSVGWTRGGNVPDTYNLELPHDMTEAGLRAFLGRYGNVCLDTWSAHDVSIYNYWYYYRPQAPGCAMQTDDTVFAPAEVTVSPHLSTNTYPELHQIWADNTLRAIILFGKDVPGSTSISDFGIAQYGRMNYLLRLWGLNTRLSPTPDDILASPGVENPEVTWRGAYPDGREVEITVMLIDSPRHVNPAFESRYRELSSTADVIVYNGHAALGENVRALSRKGDFQPGQYTIVSMMGCDTYAYVDGYMAEERARLNPDDPNGTKYLDMITNLTPTNPTKLPTASIELLLGVADPSHPMTYAQILDRFELDHYPIVTGDQDNVYDPSNPPPVEPEPEPEPESSGWEGLKESDTVARDEERRYATPELLAGTYLFQLTGSGDADLYVRVGAEPTTAEFDCRPYLATSVESCTVEIETPAAIHLMVRGFAASSEFDLQGGPAPE